MEIFQITIYPPGISGYHKKTGDPIPFESITEQFSAHSNTEAAAIAKNIYKKSGFGSAGHYNISKA